VPESLHHYRLKVSPLPKKRLISLLAGKKGNYNNFQLLFKGQRGQQKCDYNGWFLSNVTGTLIQLADEKFSFRQARQYCHRQGGALAILKNREELR